MSTTEQAQRINNALLPAWPNADSVARARLVIAWCEEDGEDTGSITLVMGARAMAAAMEQQLQDRQSPEDYLYMFRSLRAFLGAWHI